MLRSINSLKKQFLERRLDNAVFRAGFTPTIMAARQLIVHGHIRVDGKRVNKPSFLIKKGHKVDLTEKATKFVHVQSSLEAPAIVRPEWIGFDGATNSASIVSLPTRDSLPFPIEIGHTIEFYSK